MSFDYRYPIGQQDQGSFPSDYIRFSVYEYQGGGVSFGDNLALNTTRIDETGAALGTIVLPIQSSIQDGNTVDWKEDRLDAIKGGFGEIGLSFVGEGAKAAGKTISKMKAGVEKALGEGSIQKAVGTAAVEAGVNANLRSRFFGEVMNPNLELLFNGPALRSFNFSFFMSARSPEEATQIKAIINAFKKNMAARTAQSLFLKAPNVFKIEYINGFTGALHQSLNKIKTCALQSMNVDYTPAGTYSTFSDGENTMTAYRMTLQFGELDPIYDRDYDDHKIGF